MCAQWLYFVSMAAFGIGDAGLNTQLYSLVGAYYPANPDEAFACT